MSAKETSDKSKTSKTARVMNLLSKKPETAAVQEEAAEHEAAPSAPQQQPLPPIISSLAPDAAVSSQIKDALEDALEEELDAQKAAAEAPVEAPQEEPAPVQTAEPAKPEPEPEPEPVPEPEPEPVPAVPAPVLEEPKHPGYINVMQVLVEEKAEKYIKLFGLCTCDRCKEDVKALALNHLPPKYVVIDEHERIPKLTFYEGKYSSDITAQLLQACKAVMNTPHHNR